MLGWFHASISLCSCVGRLWLLPLHHECDAAVDFIFRKNLARIFSVSLALDCVTNLLREPRSQSISGRNDRSVHCPTSRGVSILRRLYNDPVQNKQLG
jgi:hypothetical protein